MDSISSSSSLVSQGSTAQPQADPLPTKRGEIGYRESLVLPAPSIAESESDIATPDVVHVGESRLATSEPAPPAIVNGSGSQPPAQPAVQPQPESIPIFSFLKPRLNRRGVRASTIFLLVTQCSLILITIGLWVILAKLVLPSSYAGHHVATGIFIHLSFIMATIFQVVLLERLVFRYRAERYAMLHPGEIVPDMFNRGEHVSTRLAIAPWNRPPVPTYAAVLMELGVGTGDVEDNHIAVSPPPPYGNTRGSTLLLAGFIGPELQEQSRLAHEARREQANRLSATTTSNEVSVKSRPMSYISVDSEWDARCDMNRATYLAETLAQLETEERDVTMVSPSSTQTGFVVPLSSPGPSPPPRSPHLEQPPSRSPP